MQDATFGMERKRNRPEKYDRELLHKTVTAVQKVTEVRRLGVMLHQGTRMSLRFVFHYSSARLEHSLLPHGSKNSTHRRKLCFPRVEE